MASPAKTVNRPDIFRYHHYLEFLKEWFNYLRAERDRVSLRSIAKEAKLSCAYLPLVLAGKRNLSRKALTSLLPFLRLSVKEAAYLELLWQVGTSENETERRQSMEKIQRMRSFREINPRETETYGYLGRWFNVVIREMAQCKDFKADPEWIQKRLRGAVPLPEVKAALDFLLANGFLIKEADGTVLMPEKEVQCVGEVFRLALRQFHREMTSIVFESLDKSPREKHLVLGHTTAIAESDFPKVKRILADALKRIEALGGAPDASDSIFHIALMAAPVTKIEGE